MANAAVAEELAGVDELEELCTPSASQTEPEDDEEDEEDDEDGEAKPDIMPHP